MLKGDTRICSNIQGLDVQKRLYVVTEFKYQHFAPILSLKLGPAYMICCLTKKKSVLRINVNLNHVKRC